MVSKKQRKTMNKVDRARSGYRAPRPNLRVSSMTDTGTKINSTFISQIVATGAASQFVGGLSVMPAGNATSQDPGSAVMRCYQQYRMNRAMFTYTPAVGTTTPGTVYVAYLDNPEIIQKWIFNVYTPSEKLAICKAAPISSRGPIWMQMELAASMQTRRPRYNVDQNFVDDLAILDGTVHGYFAVCTEGVPFTTGFGVLSIDYTATAYHLQLASATNI